MGAAFKNMCLGSQKNEHYLKKNMKKIIFLATSTIFRLGGRGCHWETFSDRQKKGTTRLARTPSLKHNLRFRSVHHRVKLWAFSNFSKIRTKFPRKSSQIFGYFRKSPACVYLAVVLGATKTRHFRYKKWGYP